MEFDEHFAALLEFTDRAFGLSALPTRRLELMYSAIRKMKERTRMILRNVYIHGLSRRYVLWQYSVRTGAFDISPCTDAGGDRRPCPQCGGKFWNIMLSARYLVN